MQYLKLAILASASLAQATNYVTLQSMDDKDRTIVWTGDSDIADTSLAAGESVEVEVPNGWTGNFYAYCSGSQNTPGMLAEFAWNSYADSTYFDVSAIVNPNDKEGVYQMYPASSQSPVSGCETFACDNAYYNPDDVQTKSTEENHIIVTLGAGPKSVSKREIDDREVENFPRAAVTDRNWHPSVKGRFTSSLRWARRN